MITPFADAIYQARQRKDISQRELSRRLGISPSYMCDLEAGNRDAPPTPRLRQMATELNLDFDYLCFLAGRWPDIASDYPQERIMAAIAAFRAALEAD